MKNLKRKKMTKIKIKNHKKLVKKFKKENLDKKLPRKNHKCQQVKEKKKKLKR